MTGIIRRFEGNDYPIKATISKGGNFSLVGMTVTMVIKIGNYTVHRLAGTVTDTVNGKVTFTPTAESVADVGVGLYEIEVHDGTYTTTYEQDDIEIMKVIS